MWLWFGCLLGWACGGSGYCEPSLVVWGFAGCGNVLFCLISLCLRIGGLCFRLCFRVDGLIALLGFCLVV